MRKYFLKILLVAVIIVGSVSVFTGCSLLDELKGSVDQMFCEHEFGDVEEEILPTCTENGSTTRRCAKCDKVELTILPAAHNLEIVPGIAATCETSGMTDGATCITCGEVVSVRTVIPALGHNVITLGNYDAPTCTEDGEKDILFCNRCNCRLGSTILPATGHTGNPGEPCTVCGETINVITTAAEFMALGNVSSPNVMMTLGADIDLSDCTWTEKSGIDYANNPNISLAFLVERLGCTLDGNGYKIKVRYDHDCSDTAQIAGIFGNITGTLRNCLVDFEARYYGAESIDGATDEYGEAGNHPQAGMKQSALCHYNTGVVANNYVFARFYSDNFIQRESMIGAYGGNIYNNVFDVMVIDAINRSIEEAGVPYWEQRGGVISANVLINLAIDSYSLATLYPGYTDFIESWNDGSFEHKNTYMSSGWTVVDDALYLNGHKTYF